LATRLEDRSDRKRQSKLARLERRSTQLVLCKAPDQVRGFAKQQLSPGHSASV
jgi:hypothetical protein